MQALLLRFLENGEIQAVGSDRRTARVDVRVIAATNRDLSELVAGGQFREDLLYRLRVIHLDVPPLRERREDVAPLVDAFPRALPARLVTFTDEAMRVVQRYRWPGNVRELQNVVEQTGVADRRTGRSTSSSFRRAMRARGAACRRPRTATPGGRRLYDALVGQGDSFWEHVYPMFLSRDITRHDVRELVRRGLRETRGNYKRAARAVRHVGERLQAVHELPGRARLPRRLP